MVTGIVMLTCLDGCGRKPVGLLPPDDAMADAYPQVYPKPQPDEMAHASIPDAVDSKYKARPDQSLQ